MKGFAVTPRLDDAFARGWPELYVVDEAEGIPFEGGGRRWVWTRAEAEKRVTERDAIVFARDALRKGYHDDDLLLFELVVGGEALADGITVALEELVDKEWERLRSAMRLIAWLDILLLRVDAAAAEAISRRVDRVLAKHEATRPDPLAEAKSERFLQHDRRNAARLAYLGAKGVFDRWYLVGDAEAQSYFLSTAGQIAGAEVEAAIREGAYLSQIPDEALAWLAARNVALPPKPAVPPKAKLTTMAFTGEGDEFGYVFLPPAAAALLQGEDDHTRLCVDVDPISLEPNAVEIYGANGVLFCRTYDVARCLTEDDDGAFVGYGSNEDELRVAFEGAQNRRWLPLTTVNGPLIGLPAASTLDDAKAGGKTFDLPGSAGTYDVLSAIQDEDALPLLWLRRRP